MKTTINAKNDFILGILNALKIPSDNVIHVTLHAGVDCVTTIDVEYYTRDVKDNTEFFEMLSKKYEVREK